MIESSSILRTGDVSLVRDARDRRTYLRALAVSRYLKV